MLEFVAVMVSVILGFCCCLCAFSCGRRSLRDGLIVGIGYVLASFVLLAIFVLGRDRWNLNETYFIAVTIAIGLVSVSSLAMWCLMFEIRRIKNDEVSLNASGKEIIIGCIHGFILFMLVIVGFWCFASSIWCFYKMILALL